jgi:ABC-type branched-subunit amino acid transport system substrate-binding protein
LIDSTEQISLVLGPHAPSGQHSKGLKVEKFLVLLTITLFQLLAAHADEQSLLAPRLRVGVIAPLTGGVATWGQSVRSAIELANRESANRAELFFEDEGSCVPTKALTALTYLQSEKKIDVLVASCLEGAQAIAPLARRSNLPLFISGRSSRDFQSKNPNALSWLALLDSEGTAIAELVRQKGWKRGTALIWPGYFGIQFAHGIRTAIKDSKLNFAFDTMEVDQLSNPTGAEVQRVLRGNPEVVFLMMSEPAAAFVVKQLKAHRYAGSIVLQSSMLQTYDHNARKIFQEALQQKFPANDAEFSRLQAQIRSKRGQEVADDFVFSYDGFKVLLNEAESCRRDHNRSLEVCLTDQMRNEVWREGASGRFRFMKDGSTQRPMVFRTITQHGFQ